jgi:hypothetical protein
VLADDPLIAGMVIARPLPLHESSGRLRELYPACPRVYGVAVMTDVGRRRWWPLVSALTTDRLRRMFVTAAGEMGGRAAASQLAATLAYTVAGRVVALVILEGRACCCHHRHTGSAVGGLVGGQRNASGTGGTGRVGLLRPSGAWGASKNVA